MAAGRKVVFDSGILILLLQKGARAPVDPESKEPITRPKDRVEHLKKCLTEEKSKILIPTPVFSEFLVNAGAALEKYVDDISNEAYFEVVPFTVLAAIEAAVATHSAKQLRRTRDESEKAAWQRVKIDIQILATAKVNKAEVIYTTDKGVVAQAELMEIPAIHLANLSLPPEDLQQEITFAANNESEEQPDTQAAAETEAGEGDEEC